MILALDPKVVLLEISASCYSHIIIPIHAIWSMNPVHISSVIMANVLEIYIYISYVYLLLVCGFNPSEKYESIGMIIPNICKIKKMFQSPPTRYIYIYI